MRCPAAAIALLAFSLACATYESTYARWDQAYAAANAALADGDDATAYVHAVEAIAAARAPLAEWGLRVWTLEWAATVSLKVNRVRDAVRYADEALALRRERSWQDAPPLQERYDSALEAAILISTGLVSRGAVDDGERILAAYVARIRWLEHWIGITSRALSRGLAEVNGWMGIALLEADEPQRALGYFEESQAQISLDSERRSVKTVLFALRYADALEAVGRIDAAAAQRAIAYAPPVDPDYLPDIKRAYDEMGVRGWDATSLPFALYVEPAPEDWPEGEHSLGTLVWEAASKWAHRVRPGVPDFIWVERREIANILVTWKRDRQVSPRALAHALPGLTERNRRIVQVLVEVGIGPPDDPVPMDELRVTVRHELGHAVGLYGHSTSPTDLMFPYAGLHSSEISPRDVETLRHLYPCRLDPVPGLVVHRRNDEAFDCGD